MLSRALRIDDPELARQAQDVDVIIIGGRSFVLVDESVSRRDEGQEYAPTAEERAMLREAAADPRPRLRGADVDRYLSRRRRELGLDH